jgi:hypothetical protein
MPGYEFGTGIAPVEVKFGSSRFVFDLSAK